MIHIHLNLETYMNINESLRSQDHQNNEFGMEDPN